MDYQLLVVEDEPLIRMLLVEELSDAGYQVLEAETAVEALGVLNRHPELKAVITDVMMPGEMTGLDLANWAQEHRPETYVLVTSGYVSNQQALLGTRSFHAFIHKPYKANDVLCQVRTWLDGGSA